MSRPAGRPVDSDREENLARILQAALECFATKGYAKTRFADIADRVGFTRSAIYQYYPNKAALYHALVSSIQAEHIETVQGIMGEECPFPERLAKVLQVFVDDHEKDWHRSTFLSAVPLELKRHPELEQAAQLDASIPVMLVEFFEQAKRNGEISKAYAGEDLLVYFLGGMLGMSIFQSSTGMGSVENAVKAGLAMLDGEFLQ